MHNQAVSNILKFQEYLRFYEIMKYPIPKQREFFLCEKQYPEIQKMQINTNFSRDKKSENLQPFVDYIQRYQRLFKSIPFIKDIYLCNSITFNKVKEDSDIDLFIIAKKDSLRRARFRSVLLFFILWLKRSKNNKAKKFCLSFYVTEDAQNIYNICLPQTDIYLIYRLAHLVPLYQEIPHQETIINHNQRIYGILPNLPKNQPTINIGVEKIFGNTSFKNFREKRGGGIVGKWIEGIIKTIRLPLIIYKTQKHKEAWRGIIVNNHMLKFHLDQRKKISLLYKTRKTVDQKPSNR